MLSSFLVIVGLLSIASCAPPSSLRLVSLTYRHGDRSPVYIYPKDKHQVSNTWADGLGWLTNIGKQQQFELGQFLRHRYSGFLNTTRYHHKEIRIEASAVQRCLMSAYSNLAGLFPPEGEQVWHNDFPWQPIPVQTRPQAEDNKLAMDAPCPRYDQLFEKEMLSQEVVKVNEENKDLFELIENKTGIKSKSVGDIWPLADDLIVERAHNLTWNDWVNEDGVFDRILKLQNYGFLLLFRGTEMARLKGGVLLKEIIANMHAAKTQNPISPKVYMYSAHDTTVTALLRALETPSPVQPPYTALVMVELHQIGNAYHVRTLYKNDSSDTVHELVPKGCGNPCTLNSFVKVTAANIPDDWSAECAAQSSSPAGLTTASWIALAVGGGICFIISVVFGVAIFRHCRRNSIVYAKL